MFYFYSFVKIPFYNYYWLVVFALMGATLSPSKVVYKKTVEQLAPPDRSNRLYVAPFTRQLFQQFVNSCNPLAAANTGRYHTVFAVSTAQFVENLNAQFGTCATQGVS